METERGREGAGPAVPSPEDGEKIVVTVIAAETPEISGRITIPDALPSTTVGEIRLKVQASIPTQPALDRLRLICAGALLRNDSQTLEQLIGAEALQTRRATLHLALRPGPGGPVRNPNAPRAAHPDAPPHRPAGFVFGGIPGQFGPAASGATPQPSGSSSPAAMPPPNTQAFDAMQAARMQHENMMQQHLQATRAALQQATAQHMGMHGGAPWMPPQAPMNIQDFQRHVNQQHRARQAQQEQNSSPDTSAQQTPGTSSGGQTPSNATQPGSTEAQQQPAAPPGPPPFLQPQFMQPNVVRSFVTARIHPGGIPAPQGIPLPATAMPNPNQQYGYFVREYESIYLLSSPRGHEAFLLSPPVLRPIANVPGQPVSNVPFQNGPGQPNGNEQRDQVQAQPQGQPQPQPLGIGDVVALLIPLGGPLWLLARLLFFTTILTWRRTWSQSLVIYLCASLIFLHQTGLLRPILPMAERAWQPVRQHIEDLVRDIGNEQPDQQQQQQQQEGGAAAAPLANGAGAAAAGGAGPDPQQAANRLLRQQHDQSLLRRAERSVALFMASLVPGVGEAQVAAREAAERARRQAAEQQRQQQQQQQQQQEQQEQGQRAEEEQQREGSDGTDRQTREGLAEVEAQQQQQQPEPTRSRASPTDHGHSSAAAPTDAEGGDLRRRNKQPTVEDDSSSDEE